MLKTFLIVPDFQMFLEIVEKTFNSTSYQNALQLGVELIHGSQTAHNILLASLLYLL